MKVTRRSVLGLLSGFMGFGWLSRPKCRAKRIGIDPAEGRDQTIKIIVGAKR